jgi:RHS repeat-associated protein
VITNADGNAISTHKYLPFGEEMSPPSSNSSHKFTGHERDAETGLDYMLARYYSPAGTFRFASVDPSPDSISLFVPQSWNRYTYSGNNPVRFFDPDGREYTSEKGKALKKAVKETGSEAGGEVVDKADAKEEKIDVQESDKALVAVVDPATGAVGKTKEVSSDKIDDAKSDLSEGLKEGQEVQVVAGNYEQKKDSEGNVTGSVITIYMGSQADGPEQLRDLNKDAYKQTVFVHESAHAIGKNEDGARESGTKFRQEAGYSK